MAQRLNKDICKIFIAEDIADFFLKYTEDIKTVEYNPLDTIEIVFLLFYKLLKKHFNYGKYFLSKFGLRFSKNAAAASLTSPLKPLSI